jgi:predicted LPLAT superfamily acyltransferase
MRRAMTQAWLRQPERSTTWALRAIIWIALRVGRGAARALLYPICLYFLVFSVRARAASREYLARVLSRRPTFRDCYRHYYTFGATILDRVFLLAGRDKEFEIALHGEPLVIDLFTRQQGCILLGAHFGSFEILRAVGRRQPGLSVYFLMFEENSRKITEALREINTRVPDFLIPLGLPDTMLRVRDRVREGGWVGCLADRGVGDDKIVMRAFLGRDAAFPVGPFRLAAALRCPVLTMFGIYRRNRRYDVHFELLVDPKSGVGDTQIDAWIDQYVARLEHHCRDAPFNWFNFYDFWAR